MNKLTKSVLLLPLFLAACGAPPSSPAAAGSNDKPCLALTARTSWQLADHNGEASSLIASCPNGDWRLLIKADWGSTLMDISRKNQKLLLTTAPRGLNKKRLTPLADQLSRYLQNGESTFVITAAGLPYSFAFNILSQNDLPAEQARTLFSEP